MADEDLSIGDELRSNFEEPPADPPAEEPVEISAEEPPAEPAHKVAPDGWSDEHKTLFGSLSELENGGNIQDFILGLHTTHEQALSGLNTKLSDGETAFSEYRKQWDPVERLFAPYVEQMKANNTTHYDQIQRWADIELSFQSDPVGTVTALLNNVGVDIHNLPVQGEKGHVDPQYASLQAELKQLRSQLNRRDQQDMDTRRATIEQTIQALAEEKDGEGNLIRPYFDEVLDDLTNLAAMERQAGREPDLKVLYDKAVRMNDGVWQKIQDAKAEADKVKSLEDAKQKAAKAQAADKGIKGASDASSSENRTLREEIEANYGG